MSLLLVMVWSPMLTRAFDYPFPTYNGTGYGESCGEGSCPPELFCGTDSECHQRTCENFYMYAPVEWTGREQESDDLTCFVDGTYPSDIEIGCSVGLHPLDTFQLNACGPGNYGPFPDAFDYFCPTANETFGVDSDMEIPSLRTSIMNRVCKAKPKKGKQFVCYDIAPGTNMSSLFQDHEEMIDSYGCEDIQFLFGNTFLEFQTADGGLFIHITESLDYSYAPWNLTSELDPDLMGALSMRTAFFILDDPPSAAVIPTMWISLTFTMLAVITNLLW